MKYEYLTNTPLEQAKEIFINALKAAGAAVGTEVLFVREASGRVSARAIYAKRCSPHYCASAMDGIALLAEKTFAASEGTPVTLSQEEFSWVDTGDALPDNCDCVVMVENVVAGENGTVLLYSAAVPWQNVRQIGEDISMGDMIAPSYTLLTPALLGALLAGGVFTVEVLKMPVVSIIPTGDEISDAQTEELPDGEIPEFNSCIFSAMLKEWGCATEIYPVVRDELTLIENAVKDAAEKSDIIIVIAGSSAGRDDYTSTALKNTGTLLLHGIAIKPGKPAVLGHIGTKAFIGVPGYPVSGITVMEELVKPVVYMLTKRELPFIDTACAHAAKRITASLKHREYIRSRICSTNGKYIAVPMSRGAGIVTGFAKADGIITLPLNSEGVEENGECDVRLLRSRAQIESSVCILGSHDPLIDEIADILRINETGVNVISGHLGSMGGLTAVKRGEAQLCGTHLLDSETGEYNTSYVNRMFSPGEAVLIKGVGRIQGIMTAPGNPHGIRDLRDVSEKHLRYVSRQRGSGTRILLDYLLSKDNIPKDSIYGYEREEYTHTAVAAIIAKGSADAGLGIFSAAQIYGLDFIPLYDEEYDFLVSSQAIEDYRVKAFLDVLGSTEFKRRLEKLGGYRLN